MPDRENGDKTTTAGGFAVPVNMNLWPDMAEYMRQFPRLPPGPPPTRRERMRRALRNGWYSARLAVAKRLLPDHDFDHECDW